MNLAETQNAVKKFLIWVAVLTVIYYTGKFALFSARDIYLSMFPTKPTAPTAAFGTLPKLKMQSIQINGTPTYILDTENASLPSFSDRIKVYEFKQVEKNILQEKNTKDLAASMGFDTGFTKLTETKFRWVDGKNSRVFQADISRKQFTLDTPLSKLSNIILDLPSITETDATGSARSFVSSKQLMSQTDITNMNFFVVPAQITFGKLREIKPVPLNSKIMKVNVYRNFKAKAQARATKETEFKILGPNPKDSLIKFYTTNSEGVTEFPIIDYSYWEPNYEKFSEYYLAPVSSVWSAITQNRGVVAYANTLDGDYFEPPASIPVDRVLIKDIYIAYYEPKDFTQYLQPIYVFEGQIQTRPESGSVAKPGEIVIYFPAIRGDFVNP